MGFSSRLTRAKIRSSSLEVAGTMDRHGRGELLGRTAERARLDEMIGAVRSGESRVLVVSGGPGLGKTALLGYAVEEADGVRVLRAAGVESEMELPFATLHQLCS